MLVSVRSVRVVRVCVVLAVAFGACNQVDLVPIEGPPPGALPPADRLFFEDFEATALPKWEPNEGEWDVGQTGGGQEYRAQRKQFALSVAGNANWKDYVVDARVTIQDDRFGPVGVAGRLQSNHFYYELLLGRDGAGARSWFLRQRLRHAWTTLASGPYEYQLGAPQVLRLAIKGQQLEAFVSTTGGQSFRRLGAAQSRGPALVEGRIGLVGYGGEASWDDVSVSGGGKLFSEAEPWGPLIEIRDTSGFFSGMPAGGWYVAAIHATLRPSDGRVLISGYSRKGAANCVGGTMGTSSQNGTTWILDPAAAAPPTLFIQPINEQPLVSPDDVVYCAGHVMLPGGRVFFSGGSRHPGGYPFSSERGLNYGRVFDFTSNSFTRITAPAKGGSVELPGEKWYPTSVLMPEGDTLTFGGFTYNSGGTGPRMNQSLELFDPAAWDAAPNGDPWTVLTTHAEGQSDTVPTRGYTNLFVLPRPIAAATGGGFARTVALSGGVGRVFLFNHEPGPTGSQRLLARPNALTPNNSATEKGEGASGVVLPDGRIMFVNGGHIGADAAKAYFYTPTTDSWTSVQLGVSRIYGDALWLPDGRVMIINGYVSEPGNNNDVTNPIGDVRAPEIIDPWTSPPTVTTLPAWPDLVWRGYHSIATVLKDARILVAAGKDNDHATGCEKSNLRIYEPPYLFGGGARPVINLAEGTSMTVGGGALTVPFTGTVRSTRGVALMAPGSLTHGFDMGQRYVPLSFVDNGDGTLTVQAPENINIAPPGEYLMYVVSSTGVPSVGKHIRLAAPPPCRYAVDGSNNSYIEAEARSRQSGPYSLASDAARSGGAYIATADASGNHTAEPDEGKVLWYDVTVSNGGSFTLWALGNGPDGGSDSFWVSVDGNPDVQLPVTGAGWGWTSAASALNLSNGKHTLKIKVREDGALVDKILLTRLGTTPTGLGGGALACNGLPAPNGLVATPGDGQVGLSWNPVIGATSYTVKRSTTSGSNHMTVQSGITGTSFTNLGLGNGTQYFFVVSASNAVGESPNSAEVPATPTAAPPPTWTSQVIPSTLSPAGSFSQMGSTLTVSASGSDIWAGTDQFRFVHQTLVGDGTITARVATLCGNTGTGTVPGCPNMWTKAGVMMRNGNSTSAQNVTAIVSPVSTQKFRFQRRTTAGSTTTDGTASSANSAVPAWLRLTRSGNNFSAFHSSNGTTWTQIGATQNIGMPGSLLVGLVITSHTPGTLASATFDNVTLTTPAPPGQPTGVMCTSGVGQCQLSWNSVSGAASYTVKRATTAGGPYMTRQSGVTVTSFTDTMVSAGTTYYYVVSAVNPTGEGPNSTQVVCTPTPPLPPMAPANLMAGAGNKTVSLTWTASAGATSYTVKRGLGSGGPYTDFTQGGIAGTSFNDTGVTNGTTYFYVVTATGAGGESVNSNQAQASPSLTAPTGLAASPGNAQVGLTWNAVANATGYNVKRGTTSGGPYPIVVPAPAANFTDTDAVNGTTYYYVVSATSPGHEGPNSTQVSATPSVSMAPAAPSNLAATITGGNQVNLTWTDNSGNETGFRVERKLGTGSYSTLATKAVNATSHTDPGLAAGTYSYRVIATGTPDSAASSEVVAIIVNPAADAYVRSGTHAGTNFGTAAVLDVKTTASPDTQRNSFLRFSMTGVAANVTSARLRLYGHAATTAKQTAVHSVASITWVETGTGSITWSNQPSMSGAALTSVLVAITDAYVEWDVTAYVQAQKTAGAAALTLGVKSGVASDEGQTTFHSREGANKPMLVITSRP